MNGSQLPRACHGPPFRDKCQSSLVCRTGHHGRGKKRLQTSVSPFSVLRNLKVPPGVIQDPQTHRNLPSESKARWQVVAFVGGSGPHQDIFIATRALQHLPRGTAPRALQALTGCCLHPAFLSPIIQMRRRRPKGAQLKCE